MSQKYGQTYQTHHANMSDETYYAKRTVTMPPHNRTPYFAPPGVIEFLFALDTDGVPISSSGVVPLDRNLLKYKKEDGEKHNSKRKSISDVDIRKFDYNPIQLLAILSRKVEVLSVSPFIVYEVKKNTIIPKNCTIDTLGLDLSKVYSITLSIILYNVEYIFYVKLTNYNNLWSLKNAACMEVAGKLLVLFSINLYGDINREKHCTETVFQYELNIKKSKENLKLLAEILLEKVPMALHTDHASDLIDLLANRTVIAPCIPGTDIGIPDVKSSLDKCKHLSSWNIYESGGIDNKVVTITHEILPTTVTVHHDNRKTVSTGDLHERVASPVLLPVPTTPPPIRTVPIERFIRNKTRGGYRGRGGRAIVAN